MKAEIEIECKDPEIVIKSIKPDEEEIKKFDAKISAEKNKLKLEVKAEDIPGLLAGVNSYLRLVKVAFDAMEA
jgi:tRNA threonylcarbamoyladenosine modification (KEOPS) complex  Pcc1 subunit